MRFLGEIVIPIYIYLCLLVSLDKMFASFDRAGNARDAAARNVIVKLARPFSGEEDLFKHMVSFL